MEPFHKPEKVRVAADDTDIRIERRANIRIAHRHRIRHQARKIEHRRQLNTTALGNRRVEQTFPAKRERERGTEFAMG